MPSSTSESTETLPVHEILRARRLERGLTLEKVREDTKITVKFILALEEGRYQVFPAQVYLRGFLLTYAKYLGLENPMGLWERLQANGATAGMYGAVAHQAAPATPAKGAQEAAAAKPMTRNAAPHPPAPKGDSGVWERFVMWTTEGQNWILAYLVFPAVLIGLVYTIHSYVQRETYRSAPEKALDVPKLLGMPPQGQNGGSASVASPSVRKAAPEMIIELAAKNEPSWMQIEADGRLTFQGILPAEQKRAFRFREQSKIRVGNPRSVDLRVNGREWMFSPEELERTPLELKLNPAAIESKLGPLPPSQDRP